MNVNLHSTYTKFSRFCSYLILFLIILSGFTLRIWNINFDQGIGSHPDERWTTCSVAPRISLPQNWEEFRDPKRSPLNPLWKPQEQAPEYYSYGHFPLYLGVLNGALLYHLVPFAESLEFPPQIVTLMSHANQACGGIAVPGRFVIALLDTLTIFLLYLLGRRIMGRSVGFLAAAAYAFTAQAVQLSHFFAMDPASTTFTVLAVLGSVMMFQDRSWRSIVVAGIGSGLAVSSKFSALPILGVPFVASTLITWKVFVCSRLNRNLPEGRTQFFAVTGFVAVVIIATVTFFITSPYAVLDWQTFTEATLIRQGRMVRGIDDLPFTRQYRNTIPYLYFIEQQIRWGLWWPLGLMAAAGTIYAATEMVRSLWQLVQGTVFPVSHNQTSSARYIDSNKIFSSLSKKSSYLPSEIQLANIILWSWLIPYFGITGAFLAKFNRYMSPVLPFVLLFGAMFIGRIWPRIMQNQTGYRFNGRIFFWLRRILVVLIAAISLGGGLFWSLAYVNGVYNSEHTWIQAGRWIFENVPSGSVVLAEDWDDEPIRSMPNDPNVNRDSRGIRVIKWSPYEEDTFEKYIVLKEKLREADYVYYSSKRIYESVDELPLRYPMTIRYYNAMWNGELGFEKVLDITTPPALFGMTFPDQEADESWSLYDHARVTLFRKTRDLTDAEFDALFERSWEQAVSYDRGEPSILEPILNVLGLGSNPEKQDRGLLNMVIRLTTGKDTIRALADNGERKSLMLSQPVDELPIVDNYRWNRWASENTWFGVLWWWLVVALLGWTAWPISFVIFQALRDRGYLLSRALGWLLAGWLLWIVTSMGWALNSVINAWLTLLLLAVIGLGTAFWTWQEMRCFLRENRGLLFIGEILFTVAYLFFVYVRMGNPDIWQPWLGGEKFMEFAFLNGILRSPYFPPVDPHFAGGYINYYYFGIYLVAYLIKLTGIYAEVAFNLAIPTLFALTVSNAYSVAYSAVQPILHIRKPQNIQNQEEINLNSALVEDEIEETYNATSHDDSISAREDVINVSQPSQKLKLRWTYGLITALLGPLFVVLIGNLDGFAQIVRKLAERSDSQFKSVLPTVEFIVRAIDGLYTTIITGQAMPPYDFWGPSRVLEPTINEFPYWSFLFADLHPHMIGIPFVVLFLALLLSLFLEQKFIWSRILLLVPFASLLFGTMAVVNLWDAPTYGGVSVLGLLVVQFMGYGRIKWLLTIGLIAVYFVLAYLAYLPFFANFTSVIVGGVGLVKEPDPANLWLLIWGLFVFVLASWALWISNQPARPRMLDKYRVKPTGIERWVSLIFQQFDRLPRFFYLHGMLVQRPTFAYMCSITLWPLTIALSMLLILFTDQTVLALCLIPLGLSFLLLWRQGQATDSISLYLTLLAVTGWAILAGTQVFYLKDHLQGGDAYRMNTLFKFFNQVWVIWGIATAIAVSRLWHSSVVHTHAENFATLSNTFKNTLPVSVKRFAWSSLFFILLMASIAYPVWGTPARLDVRFPGWRPSFGTLNGMDYMEHGVYSWQRDSNTPRVDIDLAYDYEAIRWLLANVRGNAVIAEAAETFYYQSGGTRVASFTGLSGLNGLHEREQRYGNQVSERDDLHREFWSTPDIFRTHQLIDELNISLIYVGQLERYLHPESIVKLEKMADDGWIVPVFRNKGVIIYTTANLDR